MPSRLEVLEALVARGPADAFPYYALALEYRSAGRADDALRVFGSLRQRFPDYVPQYLMAAQLCHSAGHDADARGWLDDGIAAARRARDAHAATEMEELLATLGPP